MTPAFFLSIYYPNVGEIAGYLGAFATALVIYSVPTITWFAMKYKKYKMMVPADNSYISKDDYKYLDARGSSRM